jgi:hypothetical protein
MNGPNYLFVFLKKSKKKYPIRKKSYKIQKILLILIQIKKNAQNTEGPLSPNYKRYVSRRTAQTTSSFFLKNLKIIQYGKSYKIQKILLILIQIKKKAKNTEGPLS